ncbi:bifunctional riboflavin kinase/FMN adenylyltransferase [Mycobacteroides abscessus subsp. abscessus]|nr:bifunctional riboflavin kinase/FMN adenylyltransferase [Mycobacteroides abscessus subsp. abscessus]
MNLTGIVVHGKKLARKIGFPTANLEIENQNYCCGLQKGVYAVLVQHENMKYEGVMNIGYRPTVSETNSTMTIEVHILDFDKQIYTHPLEVQPLSYIRDERKFNSLNELKDQISKDIQMARKAFLKRGQLNHVK